ncbi:MAG: MFS transporter [Thaumarchaeota archaeon]|nr:MFS transporter [Nitrososphaerota archaeon]MCS4539261.1 MFS transporter [Nitrososphaerota archaeon]
MPQPEPKKNGRRNRWVWTVLPVNGGITAFNVMLSLYILQLGGTVIDVALLTTIYNVMLIPSSIFWGSITDRLSRRRLFFIISYVGIAVIFGLMLLLQNI